MVKLRSRMDLRDGGAARELIASLLAQALGLDVPAPAVVDLVPELADGIMDVDASVAVRTSAGLNFGCQFLAGGWRAWQIHESLQRRQLDAGFDVFAFDALIENPDRSGKDARPTNLLTDGDRLVVIDHEAAFSFLLALFAPAEPWTPDASGYLRDHIFYPSLRAMLVSGERIRASLEALSPESLTAIGDAVPEEWHGAFVPSILEHVKAVAEHANEFVTATKQILR